MITCLLVLVEFMWTFPLVMYLFSILTTAYALLILQRKHFFWGWTWSISIGSSTHWGGLPFHLISNYFFFNQKSAFIIVRQTKQFAYHTMVRSTVVQFIRFLTVIWSSHLCYKTGTSSFSNNCQSLLFMSYQLLTQEYLLPSSVWLLSSSSSSSVCLLCFQPTL